MKTWLFAHCVSLLLCRQMASSCPAVKSICVFQCWVWDKSFCVVFFFDKSSWYSGLWWVFIMNLLPCRFAYVWILHPFVIAFVFLVPKLLRFKRVHKLDIICYLDEGHELNAVSCNWTAKANLWGWKVLHRTSRLYKSVKTISYPFEQIPKKCELFYFLITALGVCYWLCSPMATFSLGSYTCFVNRSRSYPCFYKWGIWDMEMWGHPLWLYPVNE